MKWIAILWSLYIVALSTVPCADSFIQSNSIAISAPHTDNHQDNCNDDHCTPFCTCSCCGITIALKITALNSKEIKSISKEDKKNPVWKFAYTSAYYGNIWQPPKIA